MKSQLVVKKINSIADCKNHYEGEFVELQVEGAKEYDILCPVLKSTGLRGSFVDAVTMVSEKNSRLAESLMIEIPPIVSSSELSDTDRLRLLASRLDTGSFAENDNLSDALSRVAKEFMPAADVDKVVEETKINFEQKDAQSVVDAV